jgi:ABC-type polar amino acid transport system ATPase subunit
MSTGMVKGRLDVKAMADGGSSRPGRPEHFFKEPREERTKQFLRQIL